MVEFSLGAGIEVTASHNPIDYNGMKIVKQGSKPLLQNEFYQIKSLAEKNNFPSSSGSGVVFNRSAEAREAYIKKIISFVDIEKLKPLKIVINSGNSAAGQVVDVLKDKLETAGVKTDFVFVFHDPDSSFPNGIPNPLLEENQPATAEVVIREKADFGLAFDGDFDRCCFSIILDSLFQVSIL